MSTRTRAPQVGPYSRAALLPKTLKRRVDEQQLGRMLQDYRGRDREPPHCIYIYIRQHLALVQDHERFSVNRLCLSKWTVLASTVLDRTLFYPLNVSANEDADPDNEYTTIRTFPIPRSPETQSPRIWQCLPEQRDSCIAWSTTINAARGIYILYILMDPLCQQLPLEFYFQATLSLCHRRHFISGVAGSGKSYLMETLLAFAMFGIAIETQPGWFKILHLSDHSTSLVH